MEKSRSSQLMTTRQKKSQSTTTGEASKDAVSYDDYFQEASPKAPLMRFLFHKECTQRSHRFGMSRRQFVEGSMGAMAAMSIIGQISAFASKAEAQDSYVPPAEDTYQELASFTRLDESDAADWSIINSAIQDQQPGVVTTILNMIEAYRGVHIGFGVDQFEHMTQCATRAKNGGASDEMILLCVIHDLGKIISNLAHPDIIAGIVRPYVSDSGYYLLRHHMEFQWKHYGQYILAPTNGRDRYVGQPWYEEAVRFSDEFDQTAFDPDYPTDPIEEFVPLIEQFFANETPRKHLTFQVCAN